MKILLAIPSYNCEKQIVRVLTSVFEKADLLEKLSEIIVFDNQSTDQTLEVAKSWANEHDTQNKLKVVKNYENYGLGGTHKVAFQYAKINSFSYVLIVHGDNQANPAEATELISLAEGRNETLHILGSRFMGGSRLHGYSLTRRLGNVALNLVYSLLTGRRIYDLGSGLNLFAVNAFDLERILTFDDGFTFNMDLLLDIVKFNQSFKYFPISWKTEDEISNARALSVGIRTLKKILLWRLGVIPSRILKEQYKVPIL